MSLGAGKAFKKMPEAKTVVNKNDRFDYIIFLNFCKDIMNNSKIRNKLKKYLQPNSRQKN